MIGADEMRKKTKKRIDKSNKATWKKIKHDIKKASKEGKYVVSFFKENLNDDFIEILDALGYKVIKNRDRRGSYWDTFTVSWEYPLEYWDNEMLELD